MEPKSMTVSQFRQSHDQILAEAQHMPITITSQQSRARAVVVSPSFYARAVAALEDQEDIHAAEIAREETEEIRHEVLKEALGFTETSTSSSTSDERNWTN
ncbi:prevent-host-death family protein [Corynebacterium pseudodiphtheriticum]|uniref:prevent-host-death family protein n=2 Tax=Corynebacterium pseudodiphtheriticum TaxID=37637 RepID=UPI0025517FC9|nr:prevent-host-death family protein [Corynebacterium pseudodiphtheriticum]MDK8479239.1 prevent-host-death family protein [Corynebacterium pseudodiphtheriticum]MDK8487521.1 prevent-host-death family protein [Corynebacterium pseudodiphtheriticum]MDK8494755.1 prevent-host-death family protein [Corynebacterium pseudodiphtheriticum]